MTCTRKIFRVNMTGIPKIASFVLIAESWAEAAKKAERELHDNYVEGAQIKSIVLLADEDQLNFIDIS